MCVWLRSGLGRSGGRGMPKGEGFTGSQGSVPVYRQWIACATPGCDKKSFATRKVARKVARMNHPEDVQPVYRCGDRWHYGHLPERVRSGKVSRGKVYGGG